MEQPTLRSARARCPSTEDSRRGCSGVTRGDGGRFSPVLWRIQGICDFPMMKRKLAMLSATIVGIALIGVPRRLTPERLRPLKQCKSSCMNLLSVPRGQALKVFVQL